MNRKLYIGIMSFFAVIFIITINFLPYYNPIYFYLQHGSLFIFMAMFIYYLLKLGYDRFETRVKKVVILRGFTIGMFVVILLLFSNIQLYLIETYQTNDFESCAYYDVYNNPIYYSQVSDSCPDLQITAYTDTALSFVVYENQSGVSERGYMDLSSIVDYEYKARIRVDVDIVYDSQGNILESTSQKSTNILLSGNNQEFKVYNSIFNHIENEVVEENGKVVSFISKQTTGKMKDQFYEFSSFENVNHLTSDNLFEFEYIEYKAQKEYKDNNQNIQEEVYQIIVTEDTYENSMFAGEPVKSKVLQALDFDCENDQCSVIIEKLNVTMDEYVLLEESNLIEFDLDNTMIITDDVVEITYPYYHYQDTERSTTTIVYSNFKEYGLIFESNTKSYANIFNRPVERSSFKYAGKYYVEHGDLYSVIYEEDYGNKVVNKMATMEQDYDLGYPVAYVSSDFFENDLYYSIQNIYEYGSRLNVYLSERDELFYHKNPLIYRLLEYSSFEYPE